MRVLAFIRGPGTRAGGATLCERRGSGRSSRLAAGLAPVVLVLSVLGGCGGANTEGAAQVELPPANPEAVRRYTSGNRALSRGKIRRARSQYRRALEIDENLWEAHYNLGVLERRAGNLEEAKAQFDAALSIQPYARETLLAAAEVEYALENASAAVDRLKTLLEHHPDDADARVSLAVLLREEERWSDALEQAREVLIRDPGQIRALLEVGRVYRAQEQWDVSQLVLEKALALTDEGEGTIRAEILTERGLLELSRGDTQAAFDAFESAITANADYHPARMNMGSVLLRAGDYAGARAQYEAVLERDAEDLAARVGLGVSLRGLGEHQQAKRQFDRVLRANPQHPDALFDLGILQAEFLNQRTRARRTFERYLSSAPRRHPGRERAEQYLREIPAPGAGSGGGGS